MASTTKKETTKQPNLVSQARSAAQKRLQEAHPEEYRRYMNEEHELRGLTYRPRLNEDEKARRDIDRILAAHPELADEYRPG